MNLLKSLTPAESLAIIDNYIIVEKLVRPTFLDLLFRQVITIQQYTRQASSRDPEITTYFVHSGEYLNRSEGLIELRFTAVFAKSPGIKILLNDYIAMILEAFPIYDSGSILAQIITSKRIERCFVKRRYMVFLTKK